MSQRASFPYMMDIPLSTKFHQFLIGSFFQFCADEHTDTRRDAAETIPALRQLAYR